MALQRPAPDAYSAQRLTRARLARRGVRAVWLVGALVLGACRDAPGALDVASDAGQDQGDVARDTTDRDQPDGTDGVPFAPELPSIDAATAARLGGYARRLEAGAAADTVRPIAWSMINAACQDRTFALQFAVSTANTTLAGTSTAMVGETLSVSRIEALVAAPSFPSATISVAGPLVTRQTLIDGLGRTVGGEPLRWYWPYHHGVVVNVEGSLRVLDLSVGDAPLPIEEWLRGFVAPDVVCVNLDEAAFATVWAYWNARFGNLDAGERPAPLCAWKITPAFTFRLDQSPSDLATFIASVPATMNTQLDAFAAVVREAYGVDVPETERAAYTSIYQAGTELDVCAWSDMGFCEDLP